METSSGPHDEEDVTRLASLPARGSTVGTGMGTAAPASAPGGEGIEGDADVTRLAVTTTAAGTGNLTAMGAGAPIGVGSVLAHTYVIEAFIARGGMGEVFRARHQELGSMHAIKVILPELASDAGIIRLFTEEARKLRRVRQDAIVAYEGLVLDEAGRRFLVMEFVDGPSLAHVLRDRKLSVEEVRQLRDRLAAGLGAAHEKGIYHRDLSPDNVILVDGRTDRAKVIDFGIAKSTEPGDVTVVGQDFAGKYSWAAPEQLGLFGGKVDARTDIYSMGLVLGTAATGKALSPAFTMADVIAARQKVPDLSQIPPELRPEIAPLLNPDPAKRPASMAEVPRAAVKGKGKAQGSGWLMPAAAGIAVVAALGVGGFFLLAPKSAGPKIASAPSEPADRSTTAMPAPALPPPTPAVAAKPPVELAIAAVDSQASALDCAQVTAAAGGAPGTIDLTGFVSAAADKDRLSQSAAKAASGVGIEDRIEVVPWPFCAGRRLVPPGGDPHAVGIALDHPDGRYKIGDPIRVTVTPPEGMTKGWLSVDLIDGQGEVGHMMPSSSQDGRFMPGRGIKVPSNAHAGEWTAQPPAGPIMVLVTAQPAPLSIPSDRVEDGHDYFPRLREQLRAGAEAGARASYVMVDVVP